MRQSAICPQWYDRKEKDRWNCQTKTIPSALGGAAIAQCFVRRYDHRHDRDPREHPKHLSTEIGEELFDLRETVTGRARTLER